MTNDPNAEAQARAAIAREQFFKDTVDIRDRGREQYADWDETTASIAPLADDGLVAELLNTDAPEQVWYRLAQDPDRAKRIAVLPAGRRSMALAEIQREILPSAQFGSGTPAWRRQPKGGGVRIDDSSSDTASDAAFSAAWDRKYKGSR